MSFGPSIVLAAFGSTYPEARGTYDDFEKEVRGRLPGHEVRWVFTSSIVRRVLAEQGLVIRPLGETLEELHEAGSTSAVVQSLHVTPGGEFTRLASVRVPGMRVAFGAPLLATPADRARVVEILGEQVRTDGVNIFVAHGNESQPEFNATHLKLGRELERRYPGSILASLEGEPGWGPVEKNRERILRVGSAHLVPLLLVAGDHVRRDLMGESADSWKSRLQPAQVTSAPPLGALPAILEIYLEHLAAAIEEIGLGE